MSAAENRQNTSHDLCLCFAKKEKYNTFDMGIKPQDGVLVIL